MHETLAVKKLSKSYGDNRVLDNLSFQAKPGDILTLLGASGAGKSSLLKVLNQLENADSGEVNIGASSYKFDNNKLHTTSTEPLHHHIGMVFQQFNLWNHLRVLDNCLLAARKVLKLSKEEATKQAMHWLEHLEIDDKAQFFPEQLSGGQKQRVAIARALMFKPDVMLFDEPTASLDPGSSNTVAKLCQQLAKDGMILIIATHDMTFAKQVASHYMFLESGHIIEYGPKNIVQEHIKQNPQLNRFLNTELN